MESPGSSSAKYVTLGENISPFLLRGERVAPTKVPDMSTLDRFCLLACLFVFRFRRGYICDSN